MDECSPQLTRKDAAALVVLAIIVAFLFAPGLGGRFLNVRDMPGITVPSRAFWRSSVLSGELPFWNPLVFLGIPTLAVPIHGAVYPGHLLLLVGSLATGIAVTWAVHTWIGAAGGYLLARLVGCRAEAAAVGGLVLAVGGYAVSMAWNGEKTLPHAWIPWMSWAVYRAVRSPKATTIVAAALPPALVCMAGDPFLMLDGFLLAAPFAVAAVRHDATRRESARNLIVGLVVPVLLAGLFAAPALLPAMLLRSATERATSLSLTAAEVWSIHPVRWLELFVPRPLGDPLVVPDLYVGGAYADDAHGQAFPWAVSLYVGAATLALGTAARGRLAKGLVVSSFIALLLALGRHLPFYAWARVVLPPLALARYPEKHIVVVCDALAILASIGAGTLLRRGAGWRLPCAVAVVGLLVSVALAPHPLRGAVYRGALQSGIVLVFVLLSFILARRAPRFAWIPVVVIGADLLIAARPLLGWADAPGLPRSPLADAVLADKSALPPRVLRLKPGDITDFRLLPYNAGALYGIAAVPGVDSALTVGLQPLLDALATSGSRAWRVLRISHSISPVHDAPRSSPKIVLPEIERWKVVKGPDRPRAWMVGRVAVAQDDAALAALANPDFDLESVAMVSDDTLSPDLVPVLGGSNRALGACDVLHYGANQVDLSCAAADPALVVFADGYSAGWHATVDGESREIARADLLYRGVFVPVGTHRIHFAYDPPGLLEGVLLAALAALACALAIVRESSKMAAQSGPR